MYYIHTTLIVNIKRLVNISNYIELWGWQYENIKILNISYHISRRKSSHNHLHYKKMVCHQNVGANVLSNDEMQEKIVDNHPAYIGTVSVVYECEYVL